MITFFILISFSTEICCLFVYKDNDKNVGGVVLRLTSCIEGLSFLEGDF